MAETMFPFSQPNLRIVGQPQLDRVLRSSSSLSTMWGGRDPFDDPFFTGRPERSRDRGDRRDDDRRLERRDPFALMDQMMGGGMLGGFGGDMDILSAAER